MISSLLDVDMQISVSPRSVFTALQIVLNVLVSLSRKKHSFFWTFFFLLFFHHANVGLE